MLLIRYLFMILAALFISNHACLAEDLEEPGSEVVGTITDGEPGWYAIVKMADREKKLYAKGDIFYSEVDILRCLRIIDIKKDSLVLRDINTEEVVSIKPGERIPLEGVQAVFESTVKTDVIEYRYRDSEGSRNNETKDFSVIDLNEKRVALEKEYNKAILLAGFSNKEKEMFYSPQSEDMDGQRIKAAILKDIEIKKDSDGVWSIDRDSARQALSNAGNTLISLIKKVEPRFRFGEGPSLRFNSELGNLALNKQGFLIKNLAVAKTVERAGIREGDLIRHINGWPVNSLYGIYKAYKDVKSNPDIRIVKIDIIRNGKEKTLIYNLR